MVFGAETERIRLGQIADGDERFTERAVFVVRQDISRVGGVEQLADVAVGVRRVKRDRRLQTTDCRQQAADAAGALEATGEIEPPDVEVCECVGLGVCEFGDEVQPSYR